MTQAIFQRLHPANDPDTFNISFGSIEECLEVIKRTAAQWQIENEEEAIRKTLIHLEEFSNLTLWREVFITVQEFPEYLKCDIELPPETCLPEAIRTVLARAISQNRQR